MPKPPKVAGKRFLSERDHDLFLEDLAEEKSWMERQVEADRAYYFRRQLRDLGLGDCIRDDAYDPADPGDRLRVEGGEL